jgi:hypothetical protein
MSKLLVLMYNNTPTSVALVNTEDSSNDQTLSGGQLLRTQDHYNVPDNSDSSKYFAQHHMEIRDSLGQTQLSFWDDDSNNYILYCCQGVNYANTTTVMQGGNITGNNIPVALVISQNAGTYTIQACTVQNDV